MQVPSPALLPLLRSQLLGELLAWLYLHPDGEFPGTELARRFGVSQSSISREADRLIAAGWAHERRVGNMRLLRANTDSLIAQPMTDLMSATFGPTIVLAELLSTIEGVMEAYLYGSWAARYQQVPGGIPRDVDVLVIGHADVDDLDEAARAAEHRLGREVNIHRVTLDTWATATNDPFLTSVRSQPMVRLALGQETGEMATGTTNH